MSTKKPEETKKTNPPENSAAKTLKHGKKTVGTKSEKNKSPKKKKQPLAGRIKLAYLLIIAIAVFLTVLLIMIPRQPEDGGERPEVPPLPEETTEVVPEEPPEELSEELSEEEEPTIVTPEDESEVEVPVKGVLYLVIDDVGYSLAQLERFLAIPVPITYAILPRLDHTASSYRRIIESGNDVILHQPMEPLGDQDPGPGALYVDMPPQSVKTVLNENLNQLPEAVGMNNHMGSKGTSDELLMKQVMSEIRNRKEDFYFLDSRTTSETIAEKVAEEHRVRHSGRNVFLDNISETEAIEAALESALEIAEERGSVVMIGHVWSEELAATLTLWYADIRKRGFLFSHLSSFFTGEALHAGIGG